MHLRKIKPSDNLQVEYIIRTCLIEYQANIAGTAWEDPFLSKFYEVYDHEKMNYYVVEDDGQVVGGAGYGPIEGVESVCELQKMYFLKDFRHKGYAQKVLDLILKEAAIDYKSIYLETFERMNEANSFYKRNGFELMAHPIVEGPHYSCDHWYIKSLKNG